jgi:hypothetical protein
MAVIMKFAEVLRMATWVVEGERERALVKRVHILVRVRMERVGGDIEGLTMPLKIRFRPKNI